MQRSAGLVLSFLVGFTIMGTEMAASRLVSPYFGTSTPVWGGLISFVLAAVAFGAFFGGRVADRATSSRPLFAALVLASILLAALPFVGRFAFTAMKSALFQNRGMVATAYACLVAFVAAPPLCALGATHPFLVRLVATDRPIGSVSGSISASSTLGSIAGTLLASFVMLPALGTARVMAACAGVLALATLPQFTSRARWLVLVPSALSFALAPHALARLPRTTLVIESEYALLQVQNTKRGDKQLVFDEGFAVQSTFRPNAEFQGEVWEHYALAPIATHSPQSTPHILLLGLGAGTSARLIHEAFPAAKIVGVEIDQKVIDLAQQEFSLPPQVEAHAGDARAFLGRETRRFDAIVVDAFRFPYAPFHLLTQEFFTMVREHLLDGGVMVMNVGRWDDHASVVDAVACTAASAFRSVQTARAHNRSNTLLFAGEGDHRKNIRARSAEMKTATRVDFARRVADELTPHAPCENALTDDHAPVEQMTDRILLSALFEGSLFPQPSRLVESSQ